MAYQNTPMRSFSFNFTFLPDSAEESTEATDIIRQFRYAAHAEKRDNLTINVPDHVVVSFHGANDMIQLPAVVIDSVNVSYNPNNTSELLVPMTGNNPYSIIGAEFQQPHTTGIQNSCTSCHRPQCTQHFENYPLDELVMPPPFQNATDFDHSTISNADRQAIRDWCNTLNL